MLNLVVIPFVLLICKADEGVQSGSPPETADTLKPSTPTIPLVSSAPELYLPVGKTDVCRGRTIKIHCTAVGLPRPVILWKRHGNVLTDGPKYKIESSSEGMHAVYSTLTIRAVSIIDYGFYSCKAHNTMGIKYVIQMVNHVGVPTADVGVPMGDARVSVVDVNLQIS